MLHVISLSIVLHLSNLAGAPQAIVTRAQAEVTRVFAEIGVPVEWRAVARLDTGTIEVVVLPAETGALRRSNDTVMGAATRTPQGTGVAYVYYRRVYEQAVRHEVAVNSVLASAMSHELGHLLRAAGGHAPDGLMRACWRREEFLRADRGQLRFSRDEAADIRARYGELEAPMEDECGDGPGNQLD